MRKRFGQRVAGFTALAALVAVGVLAFAASASATGSSSLDWNQVNGATACDANTTGTMLWIFNPHSDAVPADLTITWNLSVGGPTTLTYTGWTNSGSGQNWHLTVAIPADAVLPPASATVTFDGTLGDNAILTISGCNEDGTTPPAAAPAISKTAGQSQDTEYAWTITKAVDNTTITTNTTATFNYTVTLGHDGGTVTTSDLTGNIKVNNGNDAAITLDSLTDALSDGTTTCNVDTSAGLTIPANGSITYPYTCGLTALPSDYPNTTNTATMVWSHQILTTTAGSLDLAAGADFAEVPVDFVITKSDDCSTVADTYSEGPSGQYCVGDTGDVAATPPAVGGSFTFNYSHTFNAPALGTCEDHTNTATSDDNSTPSRHAEASKTVTVCNFNAALTIGYWKTHMYVCPKGTKTGTNGCNNNGPFSSAYLGTTYICKTTSCPNGILVGKLGGYDATSQAKALAVFNANNCSSSMTDANAAACLAAQLLAAELNVANGANYCICDTINKANALLTAVGYAGPGKAVTFGAAGSGNTRADAIALKTQLDTYNNGGGCPAP
jgi:hypothetical protein